MPDLRCTAAVDETSDGPVRHLKARDTSFAIVARAPMAKIEKYRAARGWSIPIHSSYGGGAYGILDMTALGRQEDWEEPKGRSGTSRSAVPDFT